MTNLICILLLFQIARTELIKNDQSPQFAKAIQLEYRFEEAQKLRFAVYDLDNETASLADDDFLGSLECSLGEVAIIIVKLQCVHTKLLCSG